MTQINRTHITQIKENFPCKEITYELIGIAINIHNELGPGFLEAVYEEALILELNDSKINYKNQVPLELTYKGKKLNKKYRADFIVRDKVLIELKKQNDLTKIDEMQMINYLKATGIRVGLLLNFGRKSLQWKRVIC